MPSIEIRKRKYWYKSEYTPNSVLFSVIFDGNEVMVQDLETDKRGKITINPYGWFDCNVEGHSEPLHGFIKAVNSCCLRLLVKRPNKKWQEPLSPIEEINRFFDEGLYPPS